MTYWFTVWFLLYVIANAYMALVHAIRIKSHRPDKHNWLLQNMPASPVLTALALSLSYIPVYAALILLRAARTKD
jgi:hypothetical protein